MTLIDAWHVIELGCVYTVLVLIVVLGGLVAWVEKFGSPPLLDGSRLQSALDDRDRARMVASHDRDEDQVCNAFAVQLEELRNLPTTEHPPMGWPS